MSVYARPDNYSDADTYAEVAERLDAGLPEAWERDYEYDADEMVFALDDWARPAARIAVSESEVEVMTYDTNGDEDSIVGIRGKSIEAIVAKVMALLGTMEGAL